MKKLLMLFIILFLCGCSSKYSLNIDGNQIKEEIVFAVDNSKVHDQEMGPYLDLYSKQTINSLINNDLYVEIDNTDYVYKKEVVEENNFLVFTLKHNYVDNDLSNSRILNECFENKEFEINDNKVSIHLYGKYKCLVDEEDSVEFKITTGNKIESSSAKYNFLTNNFVWKIDKSNSDNVDIELTVLTKSKLSYYGVRAIVITGIMVVLVVILVLAYKLSKREDVNEI